MNEQLQQTSSLESSSGLDGTRTVVGSDNFAQNGVPPSFGSFVVEDLETPSSGSSNASKPIPASRASSLFSFSKRKATIVSATIALAVIFLTGVSVLFFARKAPLPSANKAITEIQDVVLKDAGIIVAPPELQGANKSLLINGDVVTKGSLKIGSAGGFTGTLSIENLTDNRTYKLPDASGTLATVEQVQSLLGLSSQPISSTTNSLTILNQVGVSSLQGTPNQITVSASSGSVTLSTPQNIDTSANVQFGSLTVGTNGTASVSAVNVSPGLDVLSLASGGRTFIFPTTGGASQQICTTGIVCASGGGQAVLLAPDDGGGNASAQVDNSGLPSIYINNIGGSDLLRLQSSGTDKLHVANSGDFVTDIINANGGIGQYSNYVKMSEWLGDPSHWTASNLTVTQQFATSPNGVALADRLVSTAANGSLTQTYSTSTTGSYTFSVWARAASGTATANLRIDTTGGSPGTGTAKSYSLDTNWKRISVTQSTSGSISAVKPLIILPNNATTIYAWGAQLVQDSKPQVYVQTIEAVVEKSNGIAASGAVYLTGDYNPYSLPVLSLHSPWGTSALRVIDDYGVAVASIASGGSITSSGSVTANGFYTGVSTLTSGNLSFGFPTTGQTATISTAEGFSTGAGIRLQTDNAFCFGSCLSGGDLTLSTGTGNIDGTGGNIFIASGAGGSTSGTAGSVSISAGASSSNSTGAPVTITAGTGGTVNGTGGALNLAAGAGGGGNSTGGSVSIQAGAGTGSGSGGAINIGTSTRTSGITIGHATGTGTLTFGQSTAAQNINIGSANATSGAQIISIGNGTTAANMTVNILSGVGTAGTGTLRLGSNPRVTAIDIGNVAAAAARSINIGGGDNTAAVSTINIGQGNTSFANGKTVNIATGTPTGSGSNLVTIGSTALTSRTIIQGGTGTLATGAVPAIHLTTATAGDITIGSSTHTGTITLGYSTSSNTINIGNGNIAGSGGSFQTQTINIGAGNPAGTGGSVVNIGVTKNAASKTLIQGGTCIATQQTNCNYLPAVRIYAGSGGEIQIGDDYNGAGLPGVSLPGADNRVSIGSTVGVSTLTLKSGTGGIIIPSSLQGTVDTNTYLCRNSSNQLTTCLGSGSGSAFVQGGNSFSGQAVLGTNDNNSLAFETNNVTRATLDTSGNFEITGNYLFTKELAHTIKIQNSTTAATAGGALSILGADGNGATGGAINITGGAGIGFNTGGAINITGGTGGLVGGQLTLSGGTGGFVPGSVVLQGGTATGTDTAGGATYVDGGQSTGSASGGAITFRTAAGTVTGTSLNALATRMIIQATGNVGIGDATPASLFTVGNGDLFQVNSSGAIAAATGITSSGNLAINTSQLYVDSGTGGVGIGTATLGLAKTVVAVSNSSTSQFQNAAGGLAIVNTDQTDNNWGYLYFGDEVANNAASAIGAKFTDHTNNYSDLALATRSAGGLTTKLTIQANGNVGIGDTSPASLFTVGNGDLFQVDSAGAIVAVTGITSTGNINLGNNIGIVMGAGSASSLSYNGTNARVQLTGAGSGGSLFIEDRLAFGLQTLTITDDGAANDTLTPTATYVRIDVDEAGDVGIPNLVISEASAKDGDLLFIVNNEQDGSHDTFTITTSAGVVYVPGGSVTLGPNDGITLIYMNDRWVTLSFADNT